MNPHRPRHGQHRRRVIDGLSCRDERQPCARAVNDQMGARSQWVGILAARAYRHLCGFFTPLLAPLPTVALGAAIIIVPASSGLLDVPAFRFLRKVRRG